MFVHAQGLAAIRDGAARARESIEQAYQQHLRDVAHWDSEASKRQYTPEYRREQQASIKATYQANVHAIVAETTAARENLTKAAEERSPGALLKLALRPPRPDDVDQAIAAELRHARLVGDAKMAGGAELSELIERAAAEHDLHHLALLDREIRTRAWALTDPHRISAKVTLDRALDDIDTMLPGRAEEVRTIEEAASDFHTIDEFQRATVTGAEPLPVAMARSAARMKAQQEQQEAA